MVFKTFDGDSFGDKIGFSKRPFAQWSSDIAKATSDIDGFFTKAKVGFKTAFTVPKGENGGLLDLLQGNKLDAAFSDFNEDTKNGTANVAHFMEQCKDDSFKKYIESVDDGKYTVQGYTKFVNESNTALKATSLSSKAAAVGMKALSVAMNMAVMLPCLNNHCFILIVKGGININQLKKSCSLKELNDCEVALLGVKENEHIITKKIIKKYTKKIKLYSLKLKISVLLSNIGIKCKNIKTVD